MTPLSEITRDFQMQVLADLQEKLEREEESARSQHRAFNWRTAFTSERLKLELEQA